jgi:hypothetical protein
MTIRVVLLLCSSPHSSEGATCGKVAAAAARCLTCCGSRANRRGVSCEAGGASWRRCRAGFRAGLAGSFWRRASDREGMLRRPNPQALGVEEGGRRRSWGLSRAREMRLGLRMPFERASGPRHPITTSGWSGWAASRSDSGIRRPESSRRHGQPPTPWAQGRRLAVKQARYRVPRVRRRGPRNCHTGGAACCPSFRSAALRWRGGPDLEDWWRAMARPRNTHRFGDVTSESGCATTGEPSPRHVSLA